MNWKMWNWIEDSDINPKTYKHLIFAQVARKKYWEEKKKKKTASSTNAAGQTGYLHIEECK